MHGLELLGSRSKWAKRVELSQNSGGGGPTKLEPIFLNQVKMTVKTEKDQSYSTIKA